MAAVLLEVGGSVAMAMASSSSSSSSCSSRPSLQGGVVCSSQIQSPLRLMMSNGCSSSSKRAVLPTCRGLKVVSVGGLGRRLPAAAAATVRAASQRQGSKGIVCEAPETALGGPTGMVTDQTFQKLVLDSDVPVLVDFWAPWCGPCRMISPIIDELAKQYAGRLRCLKLNTDESPYIATEYGIRSIPTVMIFKRGEKKDTVIGAVPKASLAVTIEKYLDW